jgi:hypothetical protein
VRRQAEDAVERANAAIEDPALRLARALCVFVRFAIEHRDSAQVLWRLNSGATMADAPVNRGLREEVRRISKTIPKINIDLETGVLLVTGTIVISMRHALEERAVTPPATVAAQSASAKESSEESAGASRRASGSSRACVIVLTSGTACSAATRCMLLAMVNSAATF